MLENLLLGLAVALTVLAIFRKRALLKENRELKDELSSLERSQAGLISAKFNAIQSSVKNEEALVISETRGNELELDLDTLEAELQVARVMNANLAADLELLKAHLIKVVKTKLEEKVENKTTAVEILGDFEKELKKDDKKSKKSAKKESK
jgi:hypothetical protein